MSNIMNKPIVLQLNAAWQPIHQKTVADAIVAMTSIGNSPAALALDVEYEMDSDGNYNFDEPSYINAVNWDEWVDLKVRDFDFAVHTVNSVIRAPTVLIAPAYHKMPTVKPKLTNQSVYERDGGVCQYTGKKISKSQGNIDHYIARSKGGKNAWENMVWCDADINSKKGNKTAEEVGLKLIRKPVAPRERPISETIKVARHPTWIPFIKAS